MDPHPVEVMGCDLDLCAIMRDDRAGNLYAMIFPCPFSSRLFTAVHDHSAMKISYFVAASALEHKGKQTMH